VSGFAARAPIGCFLLIAFGVSWAIWAPLVVGLPALSERAAWAVYYAGVVGPAAAALICAALGSPVTLGALAGRITRWKVSPVWYLAAVLLPLTTRSAAVAAVALFDDAARSVAFRPLGSILGVTAIMVLLVPFEEIGWRGYLLPLLQRRYGPFASSIIVGIIWALWHLPLAWGITGFQQSDQPWRYMTLFALTIIPISCLATWLFNRTGESVMLVSLFHIAVNLGDFVLLLPSRTGERVLLTTTVSMALVVAAIWWRGGATARVVGEDA
jgi:membrane protease YdiL (CAAX protease family)